MMRFALHAVFAVVVLFALPVAAQQHFVATMNGAQVVGPVPTPATGLGCFTLNADNTLDYQVVFSGLLAPETGAHIHGPAPAGVNAGVQFGFALGSPKVGTFGPLTATQVADLTAGLYYAQIHTTLYPGGEIRGQILSAGSPCTVPTKNSTWSSIKSLYQ